MPRFIAGVGEEEARGPLYDAVVEHHLPPMAFQWASSNLDKTMAGDGDGLIEQAEMVALGAGRDQKALAKALGLVTQGIAQAPANPRGWTLLCEIKAQSGSADTISCLDIGFFVAPFDWYVSRRRALLAARLWPLLDMNVRDGAALRVRQMWESDFPDDHRSRMALYDVFLEANGSELLRAGFAGHIEELRAINAWLLHRQMFGS